LYRRSALTFLRQYNFDGLDLDWEYPTLRQGGRPQDRDNYALLIKVLSLSDAPRGIQKLTLQLSTSSFQEFDKSFLLSVLNPFQNSINL
jgi:chitinase